LTTSRAATYYLDAVNGNDSNPGTSDSPWKTLSKAQSTISDGDTVKLRDGNYGDFTEYNISHTTWTTYQADTGCSPAFTGIHFDGMTDRDIYLIFDGITVNYDGSDNAAIELRHGKHLKLLNMNVIGCGYLLSHGLGGRMGVYLWQNIDDVTIDNCNFYGSGSGRLAGFTTAIYGSSDALTISDCNISECYEGIVTGGGTVSISDCNIFTLASDGILFGSCDSLIIENNKIHDLYIWVPTLTETPTNTTWNEAGTVMTNPNAHWNTPGDTLITTGMELYINSGTNCKTGDNNVSILSVDSDTQITLSKGIADGGTPSNVDYVIRSSTHADLIQANGNSTGAYNVTIRNNQLYDCQGQICWLNPVSSIDWTSTHGFDWFNIVIGRLEIKNDSNTVVVGNIASYIAIGDTAGLIDNDYNIFNRGTISSPYSAGPHTTFFYHGYNWDKWNALPFTSIFAD